MTELTLHFDAHEQVHFEQLSDQQKETLKSFDLKPESFDIYLPVDNTVGLANIIIEGTSHFPLSQFSRFQDSSLEISEVIDAFRDRVNKAINSESPHILDTDELKMILSFYDSMQNYLSLPQSDRISYAFTFGSTYLTQPRKQSIQRQPEEWLTFIPANPFQGSSEPKQIAAELLRALRLPNQNGVLVKKEDYEKDLQDSLSRIKSVFLGQIGCKRVPSFDTVLLFIQVLLRIQREGLQHPWPLMFKALLDPRTADRTKSMFQALLYGQNIPHSLYANEWQQDLRKQIPELNKIVYIQLSEDKKFYEFFYVKEVYDTQSSLPHEAELSYGILPIDSDISQVRDFFQSEKISKALFYQYARLYQHLTPGSLKETFRQSLKNSFSLLFADFTTRYARGRHFLKEGDLVSNQELLKKISTDFDTLEPLTHLQTLHYQVKGLPLEINVFVLTKYAKERQSNHHTGSVENGLADLFKQWTKPGEVFSSPLMQLAMIHKPLNLYISQSDYDTGSLNYLLFAYRLPQTLQGYIPPTPINPVAFTQRSGDQNQIVIPNYVLFSDRSAEVLCHELAHTLEPIGHFSIIVKPPYQIRIFNTPASDDPFVHIDDSYLEMKSDGSEENTFSAYALSHPHEFWAEAITGYLATRYQTMPDYVSGPAHVYHKDKFLQSPTGRRYYILIGLYERMIEDKILPAYRLRKSHEEIQFLNDLAREVFNHDIFQYVDQLVRQSGWDKKYDLTAMNQAINQIYQSPIIQKLDIMSISHDKP